MTTPRTPKFVHVVISSAENPHALARIVFYIRKRDAKRACRWGDQRIRTYKLVTP
jgi:hypothetical protein